MSLPYRLGSRSLFTRERENTLAPKRVIFLSTEGTKTEKQYFTFIDRHREKLGIDSIVRIEALDRWDTDSDPKNVLELLEEYVQFRDNKNPDESLKKAAEAPSLKNYSTDFIKAYIENPSALSQKNRRKFRAALQEAHIDLLYLNFLAKYQGENDAFGIVLDRDCGSHSVTQMEHVLEMCKEKGYLCYITNPCFEFWQLLHVSDVASEYAEALDDILKNTLDEKKNSFVSNLLYEKTGERKTIQTKSFEKNYLPNIDLAIERAKGFAPRDQLLEKIGSNLWELFALLRENSSMEDRS